VHRSVAAAATALATRFATPCRFVLVEQRRAELRAAMRTPRAEEPRRAGCGHEAIEAQVGRHTVQAAPYVIVPCLVRDSVQQPREQTVCAAEEQMLLCAVGAGIQNVLVQLATEGLGSAWVSSALFDAGLVRDALELPPEWEPMGALAVGHPAYAAVTRPPGDTGQLLLQR
jgi:coenzyme F420-0:L-glutamate ligase/coenzyme F420-1:gamma-L-glutamate ligase